MHRIGSVRFARGRLFPVGVTDVTFRLARLRIAWTQDAAAETGIGISETAIDLARTGMGLDIRIDHGRVADMPVLWPPLHLCWNDGTSPHLPA